jgi:hypothetical protein
MENNKDWFLERKTIRLNVGDFDIDYIKTYDDERLNCPTLRDLAIIIYNMPHGVIWNFANEIATRTGCSYDDITLAIDNICKEYYQLTRGEGETRFLTNPKPSEVYLQKWKELNWESE